MTVEASVAFFMTILKHDAQATLGPCALNRNLLLVEGSGDILGTTVKFLLTLFHSFPLLCGHFLGLVTISEWGFQCILSTLLNSQG